MTDLSTKYLESTVDVAELERLCQEVRERACTGEFDDQAFVSKDIIERLKKLGVYRAFVPKCFGGNEWSPRQFCELIERLSQADGSVGWVASFGMNPAYLGCLPQHSLEQLYQNGPDIIFAGGIFPPQPAQVTEEGVIVRGRWKFSSGCLSADVIGVGYCTAKR